MQYFHTLFVSPKDAISTIIDESITINSVSVGDILFKNVIGAKIKLTMNFTLTARFKDNKIRIDLPSINSLTNYGAQQTETLYIYNKRGITIFRSDGEVKNSLAKETIELFFNNIIKGIEDNILNPNNLVW